MENILDKKGVHAYLYMKDRPFSTGPDQSIESTIVSKNKEKIDMKAKMPHAGHDGHMCLLVNLKTDLSEFKKIAKDSNFLCRNCARSANDKKYLCNPVRL